MPYLQIDGVNLSVFRDSLVERAQDIGGTMQRGLLGNVMRTRTRRLRQWRFDVPLKSAEEAIFLRDWLEGRGIAWRWTTTVNGATTYSQTGIGPTLAATFTAYSTSGKRDGRINVGSGSYYAARIQHRMGVARVLGFDPAVDGFTLLCHRNFVAGETYAAGWHNVVLTGAADFVRGASANPAGVDQYVDGALNNSANLGRCFAVSNTYPYFGLHGYKTDNTAAAIDFSDVTILPFKIPSSLRSTIIPALSTWMGTYDLGPRPVLRALGDAIGESTPVYVVASVDEAEARAAVINGAWSMAQRRMSVTLEETLYDP